MQSEPVQSEHSPETGPDTPEFGFNPLAILATVKRIRGEIDAIKAFLVKMAPILDAIKATMGNQLVGEPAGEFSATAKDLTSNPEP